MHALIAAIVLWTCTSLFSVRADWAFPPITHAGPTFLLMSESQFMGVGTDGQTPSLPSNYRSLRSAELRCGSYLFARRYEAMTNIAWTLQVTELTKRDGTLLVVEVAVLPPSAPQLVTLEPERTFHAFYGDSWHTMESPDSDNRKRWMLYAIRDGFTAPNPLERLGDCAPGAFEVPARTSS